MIDGVVVKELTRYSDERGFFLEIARFEEFGVIPKQVSHAFRTSGISNGWHIHRYHTEIFYVTRGIARLCLKDCRSGWPITVSYPYEHTEMLVVFGSSQTPLEYAEFVLSEYSPRAVLVPAGVAHSYRILADCDIIYVATADYSTSRLDEGRINYDRWPKHQWWRDVEIK